MKHAVNLMLLASLMIATGCGEKRIDPKRLPQDTPEATINKMVRALEARDRLAFLACWEVKPEQQAYLEATLDLLLLGRELEGKAEKKFGEEAWKASMRNIGMPGKATDPFEDWDSEKTTVKIDGDRAVASVEGHADNVTLILKDDIWKIYEKQFPEGGELRRATIAIESMTQAMKAGLAAVDAAKTPQDVHDAMGKAMVDRAEALKKQIDGAGE